MKTAGYLISLVSVLLLGAVAYKPDLSGWKLAALVAGMAASIIGMILRLLTHRKEQSAIDFAVRGAAREAGEANRAS